VRLGRLATGLTKVLSLEPEANGCYDLGMTEEHSGRAPALLAVVRIIAVLGMSFAIASGLFLLLWGKLLLGLVVLIAAAPFFALMRYMEKSATPE
jgi:hypothetical protein